VGADIPEQSLEGSAQTNLQLFKIIKKKCA